MEPNSKLPHRHYDSKGKKISPSEWVKIHRTTDNTIKKDVIGNYKISTAWLGINHRLSMGNPLIFETTIHATNEHTLDIDYTERYSTEEQALEGHEKAMEYLKERLEHEKASI